MDLYKVPIVGKYFQWLQQGNPVGLIEKYPVLSPQGETTLAGVFVAGDLTGVPLLKLAVESGVKRIQEWVQDPTFQSKKNDDVFDVVIVGAGPAGLAAALECEKNALRYLVIESHEIFHTIENFPKAKPILTHPQTMQVDSDIPLRNGVKEELLDEWQSYFKQHPLKLKTGVKIDKISKEANVLTLESADEKFQATRVLLCIGKSGNARKLGCAGEELPKVLNRLFDPADYKGQEVLVVGGGDSAIESAVALADAGAIVTHSYRKASFARPKEENLALWQKGVNSDKIKPVFDSVVERIEETKVALKTKSDTVEINNEVVFALIGRELPVDFFKRSQIQMEGEKKLSWWIYLVTMLSFFTMLYFGKKGVGVDLLSEESILGNIQAVFQFPVQIISKGEVDFAGFSAIIGWLGLMVFVFSGSLSLFQMLKLRQSYFNTNNSLWSLGWVSEVGALVGFSIWILLGDSTKIHFANSGFAQWGMWISILSVGVFVFTTFQNPNQVFVKVWNRIKYTYLIWASLFFTALYGIEFLGQNQGWSEPATYWYSFLYCTTMMLFGARRAHVKPTRYIRLQMLSVNVIQVVFLFLLPFHIYDWVLKGFEGTAFMNQVFPQGKWTSFGFILLWPLNMGQFGASTFWTIFPFVQTFGGLWYIVHRFGKGAYCGWICSCGGMAESLGDEYRSLSPHGPTAKKWENIGQFILAYAMVLSLLKLLPLDPSGTFVGLVDKFYVFSVDIFFAGVLGLGVYFFMGGRIWCRFGCPLAALMHIQTRFSRYRILSDKKACISCNICTKVCHMGIDVMNFANKGIPMNDAECVRCSSCIQSCPMDVLSFDELDQGDSQNQVRKSKPDLGKDWWGAGLK